jgi:hypothetical protein
LIVEIKDFAIRLDLKFVTTDDFDHVSASAFNFAGSGC